MLVELFKSAKTFLNLNLSHNVINDTSIDIFEKYILFSYNPPLEEINLSYNKFSRKGAWRLYVGIFAFIQAMLDTSSSTPT